MRKVRKMSTAAISFRDFLRTNWVVIAIRVVLQPMLSVLMEVSATRRDYVWWHMLLVNVIIFLFGVGSSHLAGRHKQFMVKLPVVRHII